MSDDDPGTVWVRTDPTPDGVYRPTLEFGGDVAHVLDEHSAAVHALEVIGAVAEAEHDAAIVAQLTKLTGDRDAAGLIVAGLRADRPPVTWSTPIQLTPGVSAFSGQPFLVVSVNGKQIGQWSVADARGHATYVLAAVRAAQLDSAYLRSLRSIGLDDPTARAAVGDLANYVDQG